MFNVKPRQDGFTLGELMVVLVITSVLMGAALPRISNAVSRGRNMEAENMLYSIFMAQEDHRRRTGAYTNVSGLLDITIPAMKHFTLVGVQAGVNVACITGGLAELRSIETPAYDMWIDSQGTVYCEVSNNCAAAKCVKMGY